MRIMISGKELHGLFSRSTILFYVLSVCVFVFVLFHFAELKTISRLFNDIDVSWLLLALLLQSGTYFSLSRVYTALLRTDSEAPRIRMVEMVQLSFVSVFLNHTIPSGGLSGNIFLFSSFNRRGLSHKQSAAVVVTESITFYIAYIFIIIVAGVVCWTAKDSSVPAIVFIVLGIGLVFFAVLMVVVSLLGKGPVMSSLMRKLYASRFVSMFFKSFTNAPPEMVHLKNPWHILRENNHQAAEALVYQVLLFLADTLTVFALFKGLHVHVTLLLVFLAFVPTVIVGSLPLSPGSLLVYESGMTFFYTSLGVPFSTALVITLVYRALSFWLTIPIGLITYRRLQKRKIIANAH